jgi:RNA polymerase sigma factor (TIGR02999 family)
MGLTAASVTQLLIEWSSGDQAALDQLMPLVYNELRALARSYLRRERPDHTLQATALVHEAYLRLIDQGSVTWQNRAQFFGLAAQMMRRILVNHALRRRAAKRGGVTPKLSLDEAVGFPENRDVDLVVLDDALKEL